MGEHRPLAAAVAVGSATAALALMLTGCTPPEAPASPGSSISSRPAQTPATEPPAAHAPPASPADPAQPATWQIGFGGVGPLVLGEPAARQSAALAAFAPEPPAEGCALRFVTAPSALRIGAGEGESGASSIVLTTDHAGDPAAGPRTAEGIGLGSTIDELTTAYPAARRTSQEGEGLITYAVTDGAGRSIVFGAWRTDPSVITTIQVGSAERIDSAACGLSA